MEKERIKKIIHKLTDTRLKKIITTIICLIIINFIIAAITGYNLFVKAYSYLTDMVNGYSEELKTVEIKAEGYDERQAGSYKITKSANWIEQGKARLNIKLDTNIEYDSKKQDLIIVLDTSVANNTNGVCNINNIDTIKELSTDIINENGKVSIITMSSNSNTIIENTNNIDELNNIIDTITCEEASNNTKEYNNYYKALQNVEKILKKGNNSDTTVNTLLITDGYPNKDTPNEVVEYKLLKKLFKNLNIIGFQYNLGTEISNKIDKITDETFITNNNDFKEIVMDKIMTSNYYNHFEIKEYLDNEYYRINNYEINTSIGTSSIDIEDNKQVITWTIGENELKTGSSAQLSIEVDVANDKSYKKGYFPISSETSATSSTINSLTYEIKSNDTIVLKHGYDLTYDVQAPSSCKINNPDSEYYYAYNKVNIVDSIPTCEGYTFMGWKVNEPVETINSKQFIMPSQDVTIVGTWAKTSISKTMDGTIHETATIYKAVEQQATKDNNIDLSKNDGKGVYELTKTNTSRPIYYYRGDVDNNNVLFAQMCFKIIRTDENGNVKLIYNGKVNNGECSNTNDYSIISETSFNTTSNNEKSLEYEESNIKDIIDEWYKDNLIKYDEYISESDYYTDLEYTTTYEQINELEQKEIHTYNSLNRLNQNNIKLNTNTSYKLKVGLITSDELYLAGNNINDETNNYLNNNTNFYTMSPAIYKDDIAKVLYLNNKGTIDTTSVTTKYGIRPVISISGDLEYTGVGTAKDPYNFNIQVNTLITDFKVGDYVRIPNNNPEYQIDEKQTINPSEISLYRVIKNQNGKIEVIADNNSSNKITLKYDELEETINNIAKSYMNNSITTDARGVTLEDIENIKNLYNDQIDYWITNKEYTDDNLSNYIRPILILNIDEYAVDGDGSKNNPWRFE